MKTKKLRSLLKFHFYVSQGFSGTHVDIFALDERDAQIKLRKIFMNGFTDARLHSIEEIIPTLEQK